MRIDRLKVADRLVAHAAKNHGADVDLIGYYGSYAQGTASERSDLDIFYIPRDGKKPPISRTFLLAGVLFDFWPITWEAMEGFATGRLRGWSLAPAIVHHAQVLHARSPEQVARLMKLKQQVLELLKPEARLQMIRRALSEFRNVLVHLGNLRLAAVSHDLADAKHAGWKLIGSVWECLALANQTLFDRGLRHILEQVPQLRHRPADLAQVITTMSTAADADEICSAGERLALSTRRILRDLQESITSPKRAPERFEGNYPEIKEMTDKVLSACERQQPVAASAAAWFAQYDVSMMLSSLQNEVGYSDFNLYSEFASAYRALGLPNMMCCSCADLPDLAAEAKLLDERLRHWLTAQSADLQMFATIDEFELSLKQE